MDEQPLRIQRFMPTEWPRDSHLDPRKPRPVLTYTAEDRLNRELIALSNLFRDTSFWWQLDGALNVSVRRGSYLGLHADIDISLLHDELPQLETHLKSRGYAMFRYHRDETDDGVIGERLLIRVGAADFSRHVDTDDRWWQLRIAAIDEVGKILINADHPIFDVAVLERVSQGIRIEWGGIILPERWLDGVTVEFRGARLNLSSPARFIFFKSLFARVYDENDLQQFAELKAITPQDIYEIKELLNQLAQRPDMNLESLVRAQKRITEIQERI